MEKTDLKLIIEHDANFFATGDEYMHNSLNLKFIPCELTEGVSQEGIILANANQDLLQSYSIAKNVFENVKSGTVKFVLIGLSPYVLPENDAEPLVAWDVKANTSILKDYIQLCLDNGAKPVVVVLPVRSSLKKSYNADALLLFRNTINTVVEKHKSSVFIDLLDVKISNKLFSGNWLLNENGTAAVSALLGAELYFKNIVSVETVSNMDNKYFNLLEKFFPDDCKKLIHHTFCRMACNDFNRLIENLPKETCLELMANVFSGMTYNHLANLSDMLTKEDYNNISARIFAMSAEKIRRKNKIKIGFFFENPSKWCGDELYNFFASDERFEPTVFYFPKDDMLTRLEFTMSLERFKSHGINVFEVPKSNFPLTEQDILIQMSPYKSVPQSFRLINLKLTTLLAHIAYSLSISYRPDFYNEPFFRILWKRFFSSKVEQEIAQKSSVTGMPRGIYSGYPRMDIFFDKNADLKFAWKMVRPDAKKIIWAPHHSLKAGGGGTFAWNYEFIYEFAKTHPETSWVVKPHPFLLSRAVSYKIFPSSVACEEYFQKWNELPNAQVYMGSYYQAIFATSDGMIHDSGSFIAEYQYVDKPMIYLRFRMGGFSELGKEILEASYRVDGRDFEAIAAMIQRIFIEGDDYKAAERKKVFDKYLNYPKYNGMLASEFIYKSIVDDLKEVKK